MENKHFMEDDVNEQNRIKIYKKEENSA